MNPAAPARSTFVTVLAWIFLVLTGMGLVVSVLQNLMVHLLMPPEVFEQAASAPVAPGTPAWATWMMGHFRLIIALVFVLTGVMFIASLGLLKRWNWARLLFIAMMALGIAWNLFSLGLQLPMLMDMHAQIGEASRATPDMPDLGWFVVGVGAVMLLMVLGFSAVQAWIIKRLLSPEVVAEFRR